VDSLPKRIRDLVLEYGMHPYDINCGWCEDFANTVADEFEGARAEWGNKAESLFEQGHKPYLHCYIVYEGAYYDSEEPEGVDSPVKLPLYYRQKWRATNCNVI